MLTPAITAYGLPVVIMLIVFTAAGLVALVVDYRRWTSHRDHVIRTQRAASKRHHPAGRHRAPVPRPLDAGLRPQHGRRTR